MAPAADARAPRFGQSKGRSGATFRDDFVCQKGWLAASIAHEWLQKSPPGDRPSELVTGHRPSITHVLKGDIPDLARAQDAKWNEIQFLRSRSSLLEASGPCPMGRAIRNPAPAEAGGPSPSPAKPKPLPVPTEMRRVPSTHPSSPEASPSKLKPRRSNRNRGGAKKQLVHDEKETAVRDATLAEALDKLPVGAARGQEIGTRADVPRTPPRPRPRNQVVRGPNAQVSEIAHEEIGGRVKNSGGAWLAWSLIRPVPTLSTPKAPITVLCNGLSSCHFQWNNLLKSGCLIRENRSVLRWDFPGHGVSSDAGDWKNTISIHSLADDLELVLSDVDARGLADTGKITLVAYSMGCQVALEWTRTHAQYVKGVALVLGTTRHSMTPVLFGIKFLADCAATLMDLFPTVFATFWSLVFTVTYFFSWYAHVVPQSFGILRVSYKEFKPFYSHLKRVHSGSYLKMLTSGQRHSAIDVLQLLDRREIPTLIVTGGKDVTVNKQTALDMRQAAPRAQYVFVKNACHAGMIGENEIIGKALNSFFVLEEETTEFNRKRLLEATGLASLPGSPARER